METRKVFSFVAGALTALGCHTIVETLPTRHTPTPAPLQPVSPIPAAPAPQPTPRPSPEPDPGEAPAQPNPGSSSCGSPAPPPLSRIDVGVLFRAPNRLTLDSTPLVGPDADYCRLIGFTDGRRFCPPRPDGHPERVACDHQLVGRAGDTGRPGPTWSVSGRSCGAGAEPYCENHPDNQFLVFAYGAGSFRACAQSGVCGEVQAAP